MRSDTYLRAVLTVIAVCLVWICVRDVTLVTPAYAADIVDVNIKSVDAYAFVYAGPLEVTR